MTVPKHIAILHYHLQKGGVTSVIQNALKAVDHQASFDLCSGTNQLSAPKDSFLEQQLCQRIIELSSLGYALESSTLKPDITNGLHPNLSNAQGAPLDNAASLSDKLLSSLSSDGNNQPDLFHIHNHALGKNPVFSEMVYHLAVKNHRLLLQIHDFAEDGRPGNYAFLRKYIGDGKPENMGKMLYPQATHIHYAVLNGRDRSFLLNSGVSQHRLHYLPNPVAAPPEGEPCKIDKLHYDRLLVYPTRAIRRKNIGELLLWAAMAQPGDVFAVTLAPQNPKALPIYHRWISFALQLNLPVEFDINARLDIPFTTLMRSADALITTSIAEGFGLAFLEPWLYNRPLIGRNLPDITQDFTQTGVDLSHLYNALRVPIEWIGEKVLHQKIDQAAEDYFKQYNRPLPHDFVEQVMQSMIIEQRVDFGRLDEELQETIIQTVHKSPSARTEVDPPQMDIDLSEKDIQHNCNIIQQKFSLEQYGQRIWDIYQAVDHSEPGQLEPFDADRLLDCFMEPSQFNLLRTS
jgi:glycosyltransferase involved in cell wall biosynthesis